MAAKLEHANITVSDPDAFAAFLGDVFDWHVRWEGEGMGGAGRTVHVGSDDAYLALYSEKGALAAPRSYEMPGGLNHIGIVVDDLDASEARVKAAGFAPGKHGDYEPGRRFYFDGPDGIEIEVVAYD